MDVVSPTREEVNSSDYAAINCDLVLACCSGNVEESWERISHDFADPAVHSVFFQKHLLTNSVPTANAHGHRKQAVPPPGLLWREEAIYRACVNCGQNDSDATSSAACDTCDNSSNEGIHIRSKTRAVGLGIFSDQPKSGWAIRVR